mmetsp:Transcript_120631/g.210024  ORF Transcript_120631/g.210024 Transcript_120631/m.210024 type:complete len:583 (+) Transcript_120631:6844-8592(+)
MHVDRDQRHELLAVSLRQLAKHQLDEPPELRPLLLQEILHGVLVPVLHLVERLVGLEGVPDPGDVAHDLAAVHEDPAGPGVLHVSGIPVQDLALEGVEHGLDDPIQPVLHRPVAQELLGEHHLLRLAGHHAVGNLGVAHHGERVQRVDDLPDVDQDGRGVRALAEDVDQVGGRDKVEPGEDLPLGLEVVGQRLLAGREDVLHDDEHLLQGVLPAHGLADGVGRAHLDHVGEVVRLVQQRAEQLVAARKLLRLLRQLRLDVLGQHEDGIEVSPLPLHVHPLDHARVHGPEVPLPQAHLLEEELDKAVAEHGLDQVVVVLQDLHNVVDGAEEVGVQPLVEVVAAHHVLPGVHHLLQVLLNAQLLVGLLHDVGHLLHVAVQAEVQQGLEGERVGVGVDVGRLSGELAQLPPVAVPHRGGPQVLHQRQGRGHVLDLGLEPLEALPGLHADGAALQLLLELLHLLHQEVGVDVLEDGRHPVDELVVDVGCQVPHLLQHLQVRAAVLQLLEGRGREVEQLLQLLQLPGRRLNRLQVAVPLVHLDVRHLDVNLKGEGLDLLERPPEGDDLLLKVDGVLLDGGGHLVLDV